MEKLNKRDEAITTLTTLKANFNNEVRVFNNLGIIHKRKGDAEKALENYKAALIVDPKSLFPNYNMGLQLS